jgi:ribosomal protein S18 acetylase RimI-like enzyme
VFTDEEYRRLGVAKSVMDEVVKMVERERRGEKTLMTLGVLAENEEAVGLYEKAGFVDKWPDGRGWEMVRLLGSEEAVTGVGF